MIPGIVQFAVRLPAAAQRILDPIRRGQPDPDIGDIRSRARVPTAFRRGTGKVAGQVFRFGAEAGEHCLDRFRPGSDAVRIDLTGSSSDLYFDTVEQADAAALAICVSDDQVLTLRFPGLSAVPSRDICLTLSGIRSDRVDVGLTDITYLQAEMEAAATRTREAGCRRAA